jgi:4-hydroxythreonine-4-phosphate dehydrogenase
MRAPLAITPGEPAGVGPDIVVAWAQRARAHATVIIGDPEVLTARANALGLGLRIVDAGAASCEPGTLSVLPVRCAAAVEPGRLNVRNAPYVLETLERAVDGCRDGRFSGMVTGPVQKSVINDAGVAFSGHTEFLADRCVVANVVMLLVAKTLRVALATTHVPLARVPALVTRERLSIVLDILLRDLVARFRIPSPRVAVAGLNPHAGESGYLGREDVDVIEPVCRAYAERGVSGPFPADTLFTPKRLAGIDAVLAMYHDQGLPVLKYAGFGEAVNVTLGLPIVRTSVDHGTALDVAGRGGADVGSFAAAVALATELAR